jgi:hypothetical protein
MTDEFVQVLGRALPHWEKALALDPASAALNAMLGLMHYVDARFGWWMNAKLPFVKRVHTLTERWNLILTIPTLAPQQVSYSYCKIAMTKARLMRDAQFSLRLARLMRRPLLLSFSLRQVFPRKV